MGFLSRQQREKLSTLGFVWEPLEEYWEEKYNDLRIYKDKYGDCLVPKNYKEDPSLAIWVFNIRKKYKQGKLSTEKMEKLNDIGFIPDAIEHKWNEMYKQLTEYKEKNGDCLVPLRYKENPELGRWVSNLKMLKKNNKLSEERVENLNKLNFNWNPQDNSWDEFYKELFDYKEKYGDCLLTEIDNANSRLKTWASDQRQHFKKKKLTKERIDKLKKIDFIFNIKDYIWEQKFNKMLQYLKKEGDLYIIHDNDLANWVILQRRLYKENKLLEYRLNKLESVGFIWDSKKELWEQRYKELIEYKKQYNTFSVSQSRNKILAGWVSKQRGYYRKGTLSEEKIALLNKIFFPWETKK